MGLIFWLACAVEAPSPAPVEEVEVAAPSGPTLLTPVQVLERASLDLRGVRPTVAEIEAVEADPSSLDSAILTMEQDARFGGRVRDLFSTIYLTRSDSFYVGASDYGQTDEAGFNRAVGDEPLRILSTIAEEDLPYTEIVQGDWSMADQTIGLAWPTTYPEGGTGWQKVAYTDGRPTAGVLSTNGLWWRFSTNDSNSNRGRANAVSRILLCEDYLSKPIVFERSVNLLDRAAVNDAVRTNEGCAACHSTLDPLAAYLWGFYYFNYDSRDDTTYYHPERERYWEAATGVSPAYYGVPGYDLPDLGDQIAQDPRLPACIVKQSFELLVQRESTLEDTQTLADLREQFLAGGLQLRPLFAAVIATDAYRGAPADDPSLAGRKLLSSDQLETVIADLTGFTFTYRGYDMLRTDTYGLRTLAGGVDGIYSTRPATEATATSVLVQERVAEAAAAYVVAADAKDPAAARLFTEVSLRDTPDSDPEGFTAQVLALHLRLFGNHVAADGPEVAANVALWRELYAAEGSPALAWRDLLATLLRDPAFLLY